MVKKLLHKSKAEPPQKEADLEAEDYEEEESMADVKKRKKAGTLADKIERGKDAQFDSPTTLKNQAKAGKTSN